MYFFRDLKRPERDVDHPPSSNAEVKESVDQYLYSPSGSSWSVTGWSLYLCARARVCVYTFTHKQYTEQHNETEYTERNIHNNKNT